MKVNLSPKHESVRCYLKQDFFHDFFVGTITGIILVVLCVASATLIFSGPLHQYIHQGITLTLISTIVVVAVLSFKGSMPGTVATMQDTSVVLYALIGAAIAHQFTVHDIPGSPASTVIVGMLLSTFISGFILWFIGRFHLGNFIRFIPYPVAGGFFAGTGWLIIDSTWGIMSGHSIGYMLIDQSINTSLLLTMIITIGLGLLLVIFYRWFNNPLVLPIITIIAVSIFFLVIILDEVTIKDAAEQQLLLASKPRDTFLMTIHGIMNQDIHWEILFTEMGHYIAILVLTPIALSINVSRIETHTKQQINLDKDLQSTGAANMIAPLLGGGAVAYHIDSLSVENHQLGMHTRLTGLFTALFCAYVLFFGTHLIAMTPKFIFAAVLFFIGINLLVTWLINSWKKLSYIDYLIIWLIFFTVVMEGFLPAIMLGIITALIIFVINYSQVNIIKRELDATVMPSHVERSDDEKKILFEHAKSAHIILLHGYLFFGNSDSFLHRIIARLHDPEKIRLQYICVDFSDVRGMDSSAAQSFVKLCHQAEFNQLKLILTGMNPNIESLLTRYIDFYPSNLYCYKIDVLNTGIEFCEQDILERKVKGQKIEFCSLQEILYENIRNLNHVNEIFKYLEHIKVKEDEAICRQGEPADELFFIEQGTVDIIVEDHEGKKIRLRTMGPGTIIGEMGLYLSQTRSASVIATEHSSLYCLSKNQLERMEQEKPYLAAILHRFIICQLSTRVGYANHIIQALISS